MTYADFDYYENEWQSETVPKKYFKRYAVRASKYMDRVTFDRIKEFEGEDIFVDLKNCMCDLVDIMYKYAGDIKAEWNGDYKVEYTDPMTEGEYDGKCMKICEYYLTDFMALGRKYA